MHKFITHIQAYKNAGGKKESNAKNDNFSYYQEVMQVNLRAAPLRALKCRPQNFF
jgi:hypothetical protein